MFSCLSDGDVSTFGDVGVEFLVAVADGSWCWLLLCCKLLWREVSCHCFALERNVVCCVEKVRT